jgi:hypothetical protein
VGIADPRVQRVNAMSRFKDNVRYGNDELYTRMSNNGWLTIEELWQSHNGDKIAP